MDLYKAQHVFFEYGAVYRSALSYFFGWCLAGLLPRSRWDKRK